jgi:hypothetical protein
MRTTLIELGHPQPADRTPIRTDNSTAAGIMDMRFWWLVDRTEQGQFRIFWAPGKLNLADYYTKKHPASHHTKVRPIYLYIEGKSPSLTQGCDKILTSGSTERLQYHKELLSGLKHELAEQLINFLTPQTTNLPVVANHKSLAVTYDIINDGNLDVIEESDDSDSDTKKGDNKS